jgi:hypothetical protein
MFIARNIKKYHTSFGGAEQSGVGTNQLEFRSSERRRVGLGSGLYTSHPYGVNPRFLGGLTIFCTGDDLMTYVISKRLTVAVLGVVILLSAHTAHGQRSRSANRSINVSELNSRKVIGRLGYELGSVISIDGIVADENYRREREDLGEILLRVQAVNGKRLKNEVIFPFMQHGVGSVTRPPVGTTFKFIGYETGAFVGEPDGIFDYVPRFATTSYHFRTSFYVLKDAKDK